MAFADTGKTIVTEITINGSAERVFDALSEPQQRLQWWARKGRFKPVRMESDLHPGGKWSMHFENNGASSTVSGEYLVVARPHALEFTWNAGWDPDSGPTIVRFDLQEQGGTVTVRVTHRGLAGEASQTRHSGWPDLLTGLRSYVES